MLGARGSRCDCLRHVHVHSSDIIVFSRVLSLFFQFSTVFLGVGVWGFGTGGLAAQAPHPDLKDNKEKQEKQGKHKRKR